MQKFKVAQIYPKVDPKSSQSSVYFTVMSFDKAQIVTKFWATFARKFVTKNFQTSPNLVTLMEMLSSVASTRSDFFLSLYLKLDFLQKHIDFL